ncbi:MarR family winged helix-turn-helix transcriptional regulator [Streptomyces gibsoniae]|uniref:MarR family transcriptional regulator n=1 Tax=Streptomyces gibsoniae TaxID=3075529 RepID=A0ABU2TYG6_9ACTN|nr:MarR family transcriptional regulator [Streptomyces sp. DSM 41699]MDT0465973.1 MarR family transcriptional regulator [Streptomyces sp. DSM 41699]
MNSAPRLELPDEIRYLILAGQREGSRRLAASLRSLGLTPAQAEVLDVLRSRGELTLAELGRLLVCEAGSPSRLVDSLVRAGLVARLPSPQDKRAVLLSLTPEGEDTADGLGAATTELAGFMAERLEPAELDTLAALLRRLLHGTPGGEALATRFPSPAPAPAEPSAPVGAPAARRPAKNR